METSEVHIERGRSLLNLGRQKEAAAELEQAVIDEPNNIDALIMLCVCYINLNDNPRANEYTDKLLRTAPDLSIGHYYKSICASRNHDDKAAEGHIWDAINLDPRDADYWARLSEIYADRKEWQKALDYADKGLECDPEHVNSLNHRARCLTKLNRLNEMQSTIEETLSSDPYNAYTHTNVGWSKLETGEYDIARQYFAEALRLNPNMENARMGMINAIKSRNFLFRWFLQYNFWIGNKKDSAQWAIMIAFVVGRRVLFGLAVQFPVLYILAFLMLFFTYLTWLISPITNLFLLADKFGRHILDADEKKAASIAGVSLFGSILCVGIAYITGVYPFWYVATFLASIAIPLCRYYDYTSMQRGPALTGYTFALVLLGIITIALAFSNFSEQAATAGGLYLFGFVAYTWIGRALVKKI